MVIFIFYVKDYIYGINPVMAALHAQKRKFEELYLYEGQESTNLNVI